MKKSLNIGVFDTSVLSKKSIPFAKFSLLLYKADYRENVKTVLLRFMRNKQSNILKKII